METIDAEFHRPRHGIYRDIPVRYVDELGKKTTMPVRIASVTDASGAALKHRVEEAGSLVRVRIGDPNRFVNGRQSYVISYTVENAILFFDDHDELYWNVTGKDGPRRSIRPPPFRDRRGGKPVAGGADPLLIREAAAPAKARARPAVPATARPTTAPARSAPARG